MVDKRDRERDAEANDFAMRLLMPEEMFVVIFRGHGGDIEMTANFFGVSTFHARIRAFNLGLTTDEIYEK